MKYIKKYIVVIIMIISISISIYIRKYEYFIVNVEKPLLKKDQEIYLKKIFSNIKDVKLPDIIESININLKFSKNISIELIYKDDKEVNDLLKKVIIYINNNNRYKYEVMNYEDIKLNIKSKDNNHIIKKYKINVNIYETKIFFINNIDINIEVHEFKNKKGYIIINDIELKDTRSKNIYNKNSYNVNKPSINTTNYMTFNKQKIYSLISEKIPELLPETPYKCFNISNDSKNKEECLKYGGVWDNPPRSNKECPYYESNKNYLNNRGKINGEICEMPYNIKLIGYKKYDKNNKPICYNCKTDLIGDGTLGNCCEKQNDRINYPELETPDYKFEGDELERYNSRNILRNKNLSVI